ncbi:MAG: MobQ family relaxase [Acutalibacteraceae bacterium]|nr:MobQ family relaxase [Acutalibacteraceae bacterium]
MAIYHLEAKVISRGTGRSAVAASAYMSCSQILNDYDGINHDYTRKQGLVWQQVFLPDYAPREWLDRAVLWNAVEENEKTKDSRLAREFVVALPVELDKNGWQKILTEFIRQNFVADGMCADVVIHNTDGHNPHAHIMLTVRPLNENGMWQHKTEKEYLCIRNGEEKGFTSSEYAKAVTDGWEKQYPYMVNGKKKYLPPSQAEGYERASKYPKSTKYGRQNPISERWNSDEQLILWRKVWADEVNKYLEPENHIDSRSHSERGLDEQPTVHEGVIARRLEEKGIISERCELNRQIKDDNRLLRTLKYEFAKLKKAVANTLPAVAEALESIRMNLIVLRYKVLSGFVEHNEIIRTLRNITPELESYKDIVDEIKKKTSERKALIKEKQSIPVIMILKHREFAKRISELTEKLEELQTEKKIILNNLYCTETYTIENVKSYVAALEKKLDLISKQEQKYSEEIEKAVAEYKEMKESATDFDPAELREEQLKLRYDKEVQSSQIIRSNGKELVTSRFNYSIRDVNYFLGEQNDSRSVSQRLAQAKSTPRRKKNIKHGRDER